MKKFNGASKKIIFIFSLGLAVLFILSFTQAKAASLGNCDYTTMSTSDYNRCVQEQTCPNGHLDSQLNCIPNAITSPSLDGTTNDMCAGAPDGTTCYAAGVTGKCGGGSCIAAVNSGPSGPASLPTASAPKSGGWNLGSLGNTGLPQGSIYGIVHAVLFWLLGIFSFIAIIGFVISGLMYILSGGSDTRMETAKKMMFYSIAGVVVGMSGLIIISAIDWALRGSWWF